jgi:tripartite-type tricarboxylate transporter receptor subunit TctC
MRARLTILLPALCLMLAPGMSAQAQGYPVKPVRLVIPYPSGGGADILGRIVAQKLGDAWGQQVLADNRGGANGIIGTEIVAHAPPDGYTLLFPSSPHTVNLSMVAKLPFDTVKDFAPIALVGTTPYILVVHPSMPVRSVRELIAFAKARPGQIDYASGGAGGSPHLAMELFKSMTGIRLEHVPYKGVGPALVDVVGGQVQVFFSNSAPAMPHIKSGRLRALGTSGAKRAAVAPDIPTVAEAGVPGFEASAWFGLLAPARTPRAVVDRINAEVNKFMRTREVQERIHALGAEVLLSTPEEYAQIIDADIRRWGKLVRDLGLRAD